MLLGCLDIGEKAKIDAYNHYIYMHKYYVPKNRGKMARNEWKGMLIVRDDEHDGNRRIDQPWETVIGQEAVPHIPGAICLCEHSVYTYLGKSKRCLGREIMLCWVFTETSLIIASEAWVCGKIRCLHQLSNLSWISVMCLLEICTSLLDDLPKTWDELMSSRHELENASGVYRLAPLISAHTALESH
jgi:hypothetical protein